MNDIITVEEATRLLLDALTGIAVGGLFSAPVTLFLVAALKHIRIFDVIPAGTMQLVIGLLLTVVFWVVNRLGYAQQFEAITGAIVVIGPALLSLLTALVGSSAAYNAARKTNTGFVSYQRPVG